VEMRKLGEWRLSLLIKKILLEEKKSGNLNDNLKIGKWKRAMAKK
jgi:hypothetical protein